MQIWIALQESTSLITVILGVCLMLSIMSMIFIFSALVIASKADHGEADTEEAITSGGDGHLAPSKKSPHLIHRESF